MAPWVILHPQHQQMLWLREHHSSISCFIHHPGQGKWLPPSLFPHLRSHFPMKSKWTLWMNAPSSFKVVPSFWATDPLFHFYDTCHTFSWSLTVVDYTVGSFISKPCCPEIKFFLGPLRLSFCLPSQAPHCSCLPDPAPGQECSSLFPTQSFCTSSYWKAFPCNSLSSFLKPQCKYQPYQNQSSPLGSYSTLTQRFRISKVNTGRELRVHQKNWNWEPERRSNRMKIIHHQSLDWNKPRAPNLQDHILPSISFCCRDVGMSLFPPQGWQFLDGTE
jgi:hypothetical protein